MCGQAGIYRPPLGALGAGLDRAVLHRVADATARSLLVRVADVLTHPQDPAARARSLSLFPVRLGRPADTRRRPSLL